ncbi:5-(carboxyamino)imidazole ribonucleotide synthase [Thermoleptolyngbya sichuanensis A183]|uniref:N5-carboxyaminoimidazole ribonucleotide synthase n=1 Tax=Thermoleptolyngbya sichuanensis A183 TaxID=2737172 RepID=A0A6M8BC74_9CYAN|nr:5-(carboxyamino)imidazole ribonucleotide synthase [Thermoleptolyngbya sichuanensis A183]
MKRVGVIGGGQLAWMMGAAAKKLGLHLIVQTPNQDDPAVGVAEEVVLAQVEDASATAHLAQQCDVITFENEFVDLAGLGAIASQGVEFLPSLGAIAPILDKFDQRSFYQSIHVPTPRFQAITHASELDASFGFPVVLKARRHGYDGYGTFVCKTLVELEALLQKPGQSWLVEEFVPFERELAVIAARGRFPQGSLHESHEIALYPVVESQQEQQVCRRVYALNEFSESVTEQVGAIARQILTALDYVGVLGIELFLTTDGRVLVNEIAPRVHNSGHYTLDACATSQFEQHLRAVAGLPLGSTALTCAGAVMVNLLGVETPESDYAALRQRLAAIPQAQVYWYGKSESRPGRKLGHVTVCLQPGQGRAEAEAIPVGIASRIARQVEAIWYGRSDYSVFEASEA